VAEEIARLAEEALFNVSRHACAKQVGIAIDEDSVTIQAVDCS
jgi:signal transduction histidine kinase